MALFDFFGPVGDPRIHRQLQREAFGTAPNAAANALQRAGQLQARTRIAQAQTLGGPSGQAAALRNAQLANAEADSANAAQSAVFRQRQQEQARAELQRQREAQIVHSGQLFDKLLTGAGQTLALGPLLGQGGSGPGGAQQASTPTPYGREGQARLGQFRQGARQRQPQQAGATQPLFPAGQPQQLAYSAPAQPVQGFGQMYGAIAQPMAPYLQPGSATGQAAPAAPFGLSMDQLSGLGRSALPFLLSDERAKEQARQEGAQQAIQQFMGSMRPQTFQYAADPQHQRQAGVMAQDVARTPVGQQMVRQTPQGMALDPTAALGPTLAALANLDARLRATEEHLTGRRSQPTPDVGAPLDLGPARGRPQGPTSRRQRRPQQPLQLGAFAGANAGAQAQPPPSYYQPQPGWYDAIPGVYSPRRTRSPAEIDAILSSRGL